MQLLRLRGRKVCDRVLRHGSVWKGKHMNVRFLAGAPRHPAALPETAGLYVGVLAPAKLDASAVRRNRMRRRCREALRAVLPEFDVQGKEAALQLFIAPRSSSLDAPFPALQEDLRTFLSSRFHGR